MIVSLSISIHYHNHSDDCHHCYTPKLSSTERTLSESEKTLEDSDAKSCSMCASMDRNQHQYCLQACVQAMAVWLDHCVYTAADASCNDAVYNEDKQHIDTYILLL
jgi:hypothetical protein